MPTKNDTEIKVLEIKKITDMPAFRVPGANKKRRKICRILACLVLAITLIALGLTALYISKTQAEPAGDETVISESEPTPTPTPTPTPYSPQPSALNPERINPEFPADITRALLVNDATATKKVAYLTFDDGPSEKTRDILEILRWYDAKATFFVLGKNAEENPDLIYEMYIDGHTIANHSYSHEYEEIYASEESLRNEIDRTEAAIAAVIGRENVSKLFRFPGGSTGGASEQYRHLIDDWGYKYVDWNALNSDADGGEYTYERCVSEIMNYCTDAGDVIVLMHDAPAKSITVEALPECMDYMLSQGYSFERIVP